MRSAVEKLSSFGYGEARLYTRMVARCESFSGRGGRTHGSSLMSRVPTILARLLERTPLSVRTGVRDPCRGRVKNAACEVRFLRVTGEKMP